MAIWIHLPTLLILGLKIATKQPTALFLSHSDTFINNFDDDGALFGDCREEISGEIDHDVFPVGWEFDGVGDEVGKHLLHAVNVKPEHFISIFFGYWINFEIFVGRDKSHDLDGFIDDIVQILRSKNWLKFIVLEQAPV